MLENKSSGNLNPQVTPSSPPGTGRTARRRPVAVGGGVPGHREQLRPGSREYGDLEQGLLGKRSLE